MNILVALDSSATAQAALAATLARDWPEASSFRVLTVLPGKESWSEGQKIVSTDLYRAHRLIDRAVSKIEICNPHSTVMGQTELGDAAKCILECASAWPADLIIVGSHNRGPIERFFTGSVSRAVFQDADCSVLIGRNIEEPAKVNRVLVAVDDSYNSKIAVDALLAAKWPANTQFKLLTAAHINYGIYNFEPNGMAFINAIEVHEEYLYGVNETLNRIKSKLVDRFGPARVECIAIEGEPWQVIVETAKNWDAQLIMIGASERPGLTLKLFGSLSRTVALNATCSVQAVRSSRAPTHAGIVAAQKRHRLGLAIDSN